jgi:hypothetical protein
MNLKQSTNTIVMVRPFNFGYNYETADNNAFQTIDEQDPILISQKAVEEFDNAVAKLRSHGIEVIVWQDSKDPVKTDAVFPNNWFSTHEDGTLLLYPMFSKNRRLERDEDLINLLRSKYEISRDYTMEHYEEDEVFLEGTGSLILDHTHKVVYACRSVRTDVELFDKWCVIMGYRGVYFDAVDQHENQIYHTNVMMAIGSSYAVICLDAIKTEESRAKVVSTLQVSGKEIVDISFDQMKAFAGNMIEVRGSLGELYLVMSQTAYNSLDERQKTLISSRSTPLILSVDTIERYGGGSARCMIAEIFLTAKK